MANENGNSTSRTARIVQLTALLSALTTTLVGYNTWKVDQFETELARVESDRELNFRIYHSISQALATNDARHLRAVRTIVVSMAPENMKAGFLDALDAGEVAIYQAEQVEISIPTARRSPVSSTTPPARAA